MKWSRNTTLCPSTILHRITITITTITGGGISILPPYRLHLNRVPRILSSFILLFSAFLATDRWESVLLARKAAKNSPVIESILCKPISDPHLFVPVLSSQQWYHPLLFLSPRFAIYRAWYAAEGKYCLLPHFRPLIPSFPPLSICVQILNHVGMGENESGKGPTRRRRKRDGMGKGAGAVVAA